MPEVTRQDLQDFLLTGTEYIECRRKEFLMQSMKGPEWRVQLRMLWRITQLGVHLTTGVLIAVSSGLIWMPHSRRHQPVIGWWHARLCRILNVRVRTHGEPLQGTGLWVSNHVSWLDIPVLGSRFPVYFLAKAEIAGWPVLGSLAKASGTLFIKRGSGDSRQVGSTLAVHLKAGRNVLFFPEGTTTDGHALKRFFHRLFVAAVETDCEIQPALICYRHEDGLHPLAPFIGDDEFFSHVLLLMRADPIDVDVMLLPPVSREGRDARALALHLEQVMGQALAKLIAQKG